MQTTQNIIRPKTGAYSVLSSECAWGYIFTNEWAWALVAFTLPSAVANYKVSFIVQNAVGLSLTSAWWDTINWNPSLSSINVWDVIELICINNNEWIATITNNNVTPPSNTFPRPIAMFGWANYWYSNSDIYKSYTNSSSFELQLIDGNNMAVVRGWNVQNITFTLFGTTEIRGALIHNWFIYLNTWDVNNVNIYRCNVDDDITVLANWTLLNSFALLNNFLAGYDWTWLCFQSGWLTIDRYSLLWVFLSTLTFSSNIQVIWNNKYWKIVWPIIEFVDSSDVNIPSIPVIQTGSILFSTNIFWYCYALVAPSSVCLPAIDLS